jgi:DNA-directed RNA polymerase subunit H (RpoH/RPB5)
MSLLQKIFKSRNVIIDMLDSRKGEYNTSPFSNFSIQEIDSMLQNNTSKLSDSSNNPLDMTIKLTGSKKCIIKYVMVSKIRINNIQMYVMDMVNNVLKKGDELILITKDKLSNDSSLSELFDSYYKLNNIFIQIFWLDTLIINITEHELVPKHRVLEEKEKAILLEKYNLSSLNKIPVIAKNDPVAKFYGMHKGDVVEITRPSETAGQYICYRYCN